MNTFKPCHKFIPVLFALGPSLLLASSAQASSSFDSSAALSYTINSITNNDNAGSLAGLAITGSFDLAAAPDYSVDLSGDGAVFGNNPSTGNVAINPILTGTAFSHSFSVSGSASAGSANTSQLGLFGLNFKNTGSENYTISLSLNYQLNSTVGGQLADSSVALDFFNETSSFTGSKRVDASVFSLENAALNATSDIFSFTLAPGTNETLYADVNITGNLSASAVPLPASFWLLFAGLSGIVSVGKGRRQQA
ncbi:MAG: VPLPA-CTERM sorting domain-containing protein [Methylococcaceae bacterium]|nr:VPLPA-CTERM sorting domain-containing protein [Methylococcaceae bacterium]